LNVAGHNLNLLEILERMKMVLAKNSLRKWFEVLGVNTETILETEITN